MLEEKIKQLTFSINDFCQLSRKMIELSLDGLIENKKSFLHEVIEKYEPKANRLEIEIDNLCTVIIAQYEPKAKNLRKILMIMKMNNDLERICDHAVNIAQSAEYLIKNAPLKPYLDLPIMATKTIEMLNDSFKSFYKEDTKLAENVCSRDNIVDNLNEQITRELITYMTAAEPDTIKKALEIIKITKNLERIADLSTNIAEDVIYYVEGENIKHKYNTE